MTSILTHLARRDHFLKIFHEEVEHRDSCNELVDSSHIHPWLRTEAEWARNERNAMMAAINEMVPEHPIDVDTYLREIGIQARGHCDYASKLALYCAEYVQRYQRDNE